MAVQAPQQHLTLFPPGITTHRELMMDSFQGFGSVYAAPVGYGVVPPLSQTGMMETVVPMYGDAAMAQMVPAKTAAVKSESGVTYAVPASRKRCRSDAFNLPALPLTNQAVNNSCASFTFLGEDLSFHFLQQQLEIDWYIAQHTEKLRMEIKEGRKRFSRRIAAVFHVNMVKRLKSKEEEIAKIGKLNLALEERIKSLCVENQILKELAETNEATANALRCNLEQVVAQVQDEDEDEDEDLQDFRQRAEDAESCCGSNLDEDGNYDDKSSRKSKGGRMCRSCGKEESCVVLLPCRHLCLCTVCGSSLHTCPVCNSAKTASVLVNLSAA